MERHIRRTHTHGGHLYMKRQYARSDTEHAYEGTCTQKKHAHERDMLMKGHPHEGHAHEGTRT